MRETLEDIVREMRYGRIPQHRHDNELLRKFADRIEAAAKARTPKMKEVRNEG